MRIISASLPTAKPSKTRSGPMKRRFPRWRKSPAIWRSIRTRSGSRRWRNVIASASEAIRSHKGSWIASSPCSSQWRKNAGLPPPSHPENGEAEDKQDQEDHDEDIEQEAGDIR